MISAYFGNFGGCYAPEILMQPLYELMDAYRYYAKDRAFTDNIRQHAIDFIGRPTPLTFAKRLTEHCGGAKIYLKREDLAHTGSHKINNAMGQALLAQAMGKTRIIAETGAGQHGVATASVCALLGIDCTIYMGAKDVERQSLNVKRIQLLGAKIHAVNTGNGTLKDAVSAAMRDWATHPDTYYLLGSVLGPHPYPTMVRDFQTVIGREARTQIMTAIGKLPEHLIACIGGGSNAIGLFHPFLNDINVNMTGVEAGGHGIETGNHAARLASGKMGVFQGTKTYLLQNEHGQILETSSISAGLDYPALGPEHAFLHESNRVQYTSATDSEALNAALTLTRLEGIMPALESAHAIAFAMQQAGKMQPSEAIIVNLSGRGDKDVETIAQALKRGISCA